MKIETTENIVREGIVLHLDAGQKNSYPGSGATWTTSYNGPAELETIHSLVYCGNGIVLAGDGNLYYTLNI